MLKKNQLPSMTSKRSHHLIKRFMLIGIQFNRVSVNKDIKGLQRNSPYGY